MDAGIVHQAGDRTAFGDPGEDLTDGGFVGDVADHGMADRSAAGPRDADDGNAAAVELAGDCQANALGTTGDDDLALSHP